LTFSQKLTFSRSIWNSGAAINGVIGCQLSVISSQFSHQAIEGSLPSAFCLPHSRGPKIAVPIRTIVAPSSMATSKS
jgi:hypothetical protein